MISQMNNKILLKSLASWKILRTEVWYSLANLSKWQPNKRVNADVPRRQLPGFNSPISVVHFIKFQRWSARRLRAGPLYQNEAMNLLSKTYNLFILSFVLLISIGCSQAPTNTDVNVATKRLLSNYEPCANFQLKE